MGVCVLFPTRWKRRKQMRFVKMMVITGLMLCLVLPGTALADDVDKCFAGVEKTTDSITKELAGLDEKAYVKKSRSFGDNIEKSWRKCAQCLSKKYKPKGGGKSDLETSLMRGKPAYNATDGNDWMSNGLIIKCIGMALDAYQGSEKTKDSDSFKKLSKKEQAKELKNILANQKKVINATAGYCFKKENAAYKKRLKEYLEKNYQ